MATDAGSSRVKEFPLPDLGEGLTEGEILTWFVAEGDLVTLNQPIVEVETAKAAVEIPSKWAGRVIKIFHDAGTTVEVGAPIIAIDTQPDAGPVDAASTASASGAPTSAPPAPPTTHGSAPSSAPPAGGSPAQPAAEVAVEAGLIGGPAPGGRTAVLVGYGPRLTSAMRRPRKATAATTTGQSSAQASAASVAAPVSPVRPVSPAPPASVATASRPAAGAVVLAKPPVRKLARDLGVDLHSVRGSGPQGSVTRDDVHAAVGAAARPSAQPAFPPATEPAFGPDREQRVTIKGVRKLMAENMVASAFAAPHVTEFLTLDVTRAMRALDRLRELPQWRGVRVSPLLLVAKAVLLAVPRHPLVNSTWSGETGEIIVKQYINLGIAAATPRGLVVPNIKDAGRLSLRELADSLNDLVATAKEGRTAPADMAGGTITITNVGVFGVDTGTPILPPGESAILAFGAVKDMPWAHKGKVRVRQVTTLGLSFDHRIIDGELGSKFLRDVGQFLSDPVAAMLSWS